MQKEFSEKHHLLFIPFLFKQFRRDFHAFPTGGSAAALELPAEIRTGPFAEVAAQGLPILFPGQRHDRIQGAAESARSISASAGGHFHDGGIVGKGLGDTLGTVSRAGNRGEKRYRFFRSRTHDVLPCSNRFLQYKRNGRKCQAQKKLKHEKIRAFSIIRKILVVRMLTNYGDNVILHPIQFVIATFKLKRKERKWLLK